MTEPRHALDPVVTRRRFLQGSAMAGFGAFLAACGGGGGGLASPSAAASPAPTGVLKFANWPAYIDLAGAAGDAGEYAPGSSPSLEEFKTTYGVDVDYQEKIGDNATFFATIEPALVAGLPTGWDLIVLTQWLAAKLVASSWVETLEKANVPNAVANLRAPMRGIAFDPDNTYHYPWQSGMAGVGANTLALKENNIPEPTKIADLWNIRPDRVTFLTEARDTFGLGLLKLGITPNDKTVTNADLDKVYADIQPLVDKGLRFADNAYLENFANKNTWAAMVWSGDLASSGTENDRFFFPEEGLMLFNDMILIPKGAANKKTAEDMINFVYDPRVGAQLAAYIYYVSPVEGVAEEIKKLDPEAAENPLLFPPADVVARSHLFQDLAPDVEAHMNELYAKLSGT